MPTLYARDPATGNMVPVLGGMTQADADARYVQTAGGTITGSMTVPTTSNPNMGAAIVNKGYVDDWMVGMIVMFAGSTAPSGWLLCQGQAVSRTTYAGLFAVCGTTHGVGDSSTTFNLPDFRGRTPVGVGSSSYFNAIGEKQGAKTVTLTKSQVPNFTGSWTMHDAANRTMIYVVSGAFTAGTTAPNYRTGYQNPNNPSIGVATYSAGFGGGSHSNLTYSVTLNFIIKY
jgi:microcystin-dependent protein